jgi:hypothetical protein
MKDLRVVCFLFLKGSNECLDEFNSLITRTMMRAIRRSNVSIKIRVSFVGCVPSLAAL